MQRTVVLNVVGLTPGLIDERTPFLKKWAGQGKTLAVQPVLPAVTCSVQATYLTGKYPSEHGIVGNGWYFEDECEVKFWRQSNRLVQSPKIWEAARKEDSRFTVANMFWWFNMYSSADYAVTPRPMYPADGRKLPDCYSQPASLRDELQQQLGTFPLFEFWGPRTTINASKWIAEASKIVEAENQPTLTLIYLPHLDYNLQRLGPDHPDICTDLAEIDQLCGDLIEFYESRNVSVILLSEYGITSVRRPVHLNRLLRKEGMIAVREELGRELLDAGASEAFAVADHQVAHVYVKDKRKIEQVQALIAKTPGVQSVLDRAGKRLHHINHARAGDLVIIAEPDSWFTYYYWLDDARAPDFARCVDIHRKPGYDPVELFTDPEIRFLKLKVAKTLLKKFLGFRYLMEVIPLDASLVKGQHGCYPQTSDEGPLLISQRPSRLPDRKSISAIQVYQIIWDHLFSA